MSIWKLMIPNSVKMFVWRTCKNILLTMQNLKRRKITDQLLCPICFYHDESVGHVLWECKAAKDVWSQECRKLKKMSFSFFGIWYLFTKRLDQLKLPETTIISKLLQVRRNDLIHNKCFLIPNFLVSQKLKKSFTNLK